MKEQTKKLETALDLYGRITLDVIRAYKERRFSQEEWKGVKWVLEQMEMLLRLQDEGTKKV